MVNQTRSPNTAASIGDAMETAIAAGDDEVAERLYESYRLLFEDYRAGKAAPCKAGFFAEGKALVSDRPSKVVEWW